MSGFIGRSLLACSLIIILSACQSTLTQIDEPTIDQFAVAEQEFDTHLASKQLELAGQQFNDLRINHPDEPRIVILQQRLADAWLASGEQALQDGDVETASAALIQAKRLLPQAPALTEGLSAAITAAQTPVIIEPVAKPQAPAKRAVTAKPPAPIKPPVISEPEPEPELELDPEQAEPETPPPAEPKRTKIKARIIDANAEYSVIPMPMLSNRNDHQLGRLLDDVAVDVVRFRAAVSIEVADTLDFHWVAALLSARVKKTDANFKPRLQEVIRSEEPAQLVITPNKSL